MDFSMYRLHMLFLVFVMGFGAASVQAATYKWVDKDGNVHYSQRPPPDTNYERLNIKTPPPSATPASPAAPGTQAPAAAGQNNGSDTVAQEMAKNQEIRAKNCEAAKKNLELYTVFKRVRKEDGTVVRLDDEERAKKIEESQAAIKEFCD